MRYEYDDGIIYIRENKKIEKVINLTESEKSIFSALLTDKIVRFDDSPEMNLLGRRYLSVVIHRINKKVSGYFFIKPIYGKGYLLTKGRVFDE